MTAKLAGISIVVALLLGTPLCRAENMQVELAIGHQDMTMVLDGGDRMDLEMHYIDFNYRERVNPHTGGGVNLGFTDVTVDRDDQALRTMTGQHLRVRWYLLPWQSRQARSILDFEYGFERMQDQNTDDLVLQWYQWLLGAGFAYTLSEQFEFFAGAAIVGFNGKQMPPKQDITRFKGEKNAVFSAGFIYRFGDGGALGLRGFYQQQTGAEMFFRHDYNK